MVIRAAACTNNRITLISGWLHALVEVVMRMQFLEIHNMCVKPVPWYGLGLSVAIPAAVP